MKLQTLIPLLIGIVCIGLLPTVQAVNPPPDGGYPGYNTAEGQNALFNLNIAGGGIWNTALGGQALFHDATGNINTAVGVNALFNNTTGNANVAVGASALKLGTTGNNNTAVGVNALFNNQGNSNTAIGVNALVTNTAGAQNVAVGQGALASNSNGNYNTAIGYSALHRGGNFNTASGAYALTSNATGGSNTATGANALQTNTTGNNNTATGTAALAFSVGNDNTANGYAALANNGGGSSNTAIGSNALFEIGLEAVGNGNTAVGAGALAQLGNASMGPGYGHNNTALGVNAGNHLTRGSGNVYIGASTLGDSSEDDSNHTYIRNIGTTPLGDPFPVVTVDPVTGLLGYGASSRRYKEDVKPMENTSKAIYRLKPVTYRFKKEIDRSQSLEYGLVAEDVAEVDPNLAIRDGKGHIESVRYNAVNAMLLNEFLKEHRRVEEQQATITKLKSTVAQQQKGLQAVTARLEQQAAQIQKVNNLLEARQAAPRMVLNNP